MNIAVFASVQDSPSTTLQRSYIVIKVQIFKQPLQIEVQKLGFQDQEDGTILESEERSVGKSYVSTAVFASDQDSPSTTLQRNTSSSKSGFLNIPFKSRFKNLGIQVQEDGTILEGEERSVGTSYVSTAAFGSVSYSTSNMLQRETSSSKSRFLNIFYVDSYVA